MSGPLDRARQVDPLDRAHLVGIGGAGMSGIARILLARGHAVSGSDAKETRAFLTLRAQGARIAVGQAADNLDLLPGGPTAVVVSTAIKETNPELVEARRRGLPVLHRSEALAALMAGHRVACVAGTHGKTSTTSMLTVALQHCRLDPSFAIGGDLNESGANAHHGTGGIFVAEADESDGSFLAFTPSVAVVTNVEADHLDHHGTVDAYVAVFDRFLDRLAPGGVLITCADDPGAVALAARAAAKGLRVRRYGRAATAPGDATLLDYRPADGGGLARVSLDGQEIELGVAVPGEHMAGNALAALLAGLELGAPLAGLGAGIAAFGGVRRRFEYKGAAAGVRVYDDYAHHPTEVDAQLRAVRPAAGDGRVVVVFQPHMYSRTKTFAREFGAALSLADEVVVLDVFGAREEPEPGVSGALVADAVDLPAGQVHYEPAFDRVPGLVAGLVREGDLVLTMGAGDVTMLGPEVLAALEPGSGTP
ncbi:UDP-N-acetylmuramate--L-alanine ligase [Actinokineospora auranticolor]|uniref:UDP-N-acetylmuramate--L-alanine ligase n=1 Tax=Actinokineospora auranticolor TaxID=155976 RepID=A0A2S6GQK8_9PSEU|nr:UDP-N-acetylmuramate--L-alanine ligase [Actinokineospora auranticolor]PPK67538.1 UDP-N-acetylmuramate--alanine ligase [Actinokineospora auranticolor]